MKKIYALFFLSSTLFFLLVFNFVKTQNKFLQKTEYQVLSPEIPLFTIYSNDLKEFAKVTKSFLEKTQYFLYNSVLEQYINTLLLAGKSPVQLAFSFSVFLNNGLDFILYIPFNDFNLTFAEISFFKKAKKQVLKISNDGLKLDNVANKTIFLITKKNVIYLSNNYQLLNECLISKSLNSQKVSTCTQNGNFSIIIQKPSLEKLLKHKYLSSEALNVIDYLPEIISADLLFFNKKIYIKTTLSNDILKILNIYPYRDTSKNLHINFDYSTMPNFLSYYIIKPSNNEQKTSFLDITKFISKKIAYTKQNQEYLYFLESEEPEKLKNILLSEGIIDLNKSNFKNQNKTFYLNSRVLNLQIFNKFQEPIAFKRIFFNKKAIILSTSNSLLETYLSTLKFDGCKKLFIQNNAYFSYYTDNSSLNKKALKSDLLKFVDLSKRMTVELTFFSEKKSIIEIMVDF